MAAEGHLGMKRPQLFEPNFKQGGKENNNLINHHVWINQRKKIGLTRNTKFSREKLQSQRAQIVRKISFIERNFKKKECMRFVRNRTIKDQKNPRCKCGGTEQAHLGVKRQIQKSGLIPEEKEEEAISVSNTLPIIKVGKYAQEHRPSTLSNGVLLEPDDLEELLDLGSSNSPRNNQSNDWRSSKLEIKEYMTDAFGTLLFNSKNDDHTLIPSEYIRVSDESDSAHLFELFASFWKILGDGNKRHLSMNIIGNHSTPVQLTQKQKQTFKDGLVKTTKVSKALVVTDGLDSGIGKVVGDVIGEAQFAIQTENGMTHGLPILGISPWGALSQRAELVNPKPSRINEVVLDVTDSDQEDFDRQSIDLDPNHTHFLLVDDGYRNDFSPTALNRFRSEILELMKSMEIPVISLLMQGNIEDLFSVQELLRQGHICLAFKGLGGMSDILCYAREKATLKRESTTEFKLSDYHLTKIKTMIEYGFENEFDKDDIRKIMDCLYDCIAHGASIITFDLERDNNLDKTILGALFNREKDASKRIAMCINWERLDLAETLLFEGESADKLKNIDHLVQLCLLEQKPEFLEILFKSGIVLKHYLTVEKLRILYNDAFSRWSQLRLQLDHFVPDFDFDVSQLYLIHIHQFLSQILRCHSFAPYEMDRPRQKFTSSLKVIMKDISSITFQDPDMELFIWAVICKKQRLLEFFWHRCHQPIFCAEVAAILYKNLARFYDKDPRKEGLLALEKHFITLVNEMLEQAHEMDRFKTFSLLETRIPRVNDMTILTLATCGDLRSVIANPQCQSNVQVNWKRGFAKLSIIRGLLCLVCPVLLFTPLVSYKPGLGDGGGKLNPYQKLYVFWKCPMTKFCAWFLSFISLAVLHSYVALYSYRWEFLPSEWALYLWYLVLMVTEIREVFEQRATGMRNKLRIHWNSIWNKFDICLLVFSLFNFILKNFESTFWVSRILFACNSIPVYFQLFRYYHASIKLGPKLVILTDMLPEILTFVLLLAIFMLAYGVASQALINPYRRHEWSGFPGLLYDIFLLPYWQMYGELSLDELTIKDVPPCSVNATFEDYCYRTDIERIEDYRYVMPVLLALYMLFANVLLMNLLIAVFSSVFEQIHNNSMGVWKWEMCRLMEDFDQRTTLAPPFNILEQIYFILKSTWKRCCRREKEDLDLYLNEANLSLKVFEKTCLSLFWSRKQSQTNDNITSRLKTVEEKTDAILSKFNTPPDWTDPSLVPNYQTENCHAKIQRILTLRAQDKPVDPNGNQLATLKEDVSDLKTRMKQIERVLHSILRAVEKPKKE